MEQNRDPRIENCTKKTLPSIPNSLLQPRNLFHIPYLKGHVWMWEFDYKERWAPKNWCFWTVILKKTLESPLDCKEVQSIHSEGDQPWNFFGRNDAKAETLVLWPPHVKNWLIGKDSDAGRDGGRRRRDDRGWDGWMASLTQWTWVWVNSESWWWTGRPDMLWFMRSQRVGHDWVTELNWSEPTSKILRLEVYLTQNSK